MSVNEILIKNLLQHIKETISVEVGKNKGVQIRIEQNEKIKQFDPESEIFEMFTFPPGEGQIMAFVRQYLTASVMMGDIQDEKEGHEETERVFVIFEKYFIKHSTDYESLEKAKKNVLDSLKSATDLIRMRECIERFREIEPSDIHTKEDEGELVFHSNPTAGSRTNNVTIGTLQDLLDENTEPLEPGSKIRPGK
jgi:hypothetical protein